MSFLALYNFYNSNYWLLIASKKRSFRSNPGIITCHLTAVSRLSLQFYRYRPAIYSDDCGDASDTFSDGVTFAGTAQAKGRAGMRRAPFGRQLLRPSLTRAPRRRSSGQGPAGRWQPYVPRESSAPARARGSRPRPAPRPGGRRIQGRPCSSGRRDAGGCSP